MLGSAVLADDDARLPFDLIAATGNDRFIAHGGEGVQAVVGSVVGVLDGDTGLHVIGHPTRGQVPDPDVEGDAAGTRQHQGLSASAGEVGRASGMIDGAFHDGLDQLVHIGAKHFHLPIADT